MLKIPGTPMQKEFLFGNVNYPTFLGTYSNVENLSSIVLTKDSEFREMFD